MKVLLIQGSPRHLNNCPQEWPKTTFAINYLYRNSPHGVEFDVLDLSVPMEKRRIQPCKGCVSTAGGLHCHWACLPATERVLMADGRFKSIAKIEAGERVSTGLVTRAWQTSRSEPVLKVKLSDGRELRATGNHQIQTIGLRRRVSVGRGETKPVYDADWTRVDALKPGDRLPTIHQGLFPDDRGIDIEWFYLAGLVWGDGSYEGYKKRGARLYFDNRNRRHADYVKNFWPRPHTEHEVSVTDSDRGAPTSADGHMRFLRFGNEAGTYLHEYVGLHKTMPANERRISSGIMNASWNEVVAFLDGWFATDGHVCVGENGQLSVGLTNTSYHCLRDAQLLLYKLGIKASLADNRDKVTNGLGKEYARSSQLAMAGRDAWTFVATVGLSNPYQAEKLATARPPQRELDHPYADVVSVAEDGVEAVYDLTVEGTHEFVAEGCLVHNCTCYGPGSREADLPDLMWDENVYGRLEESDGFILLTPIHWYSVPTQVKAMFDRLVCANLTLTRKQAVELLRPGGVTARHMSESKLPIYVKDPKITKPAFRTGRFNQYLSNHLAGKVAAFFVHGDGGAGDYVRNTPPMSYVRASHDREPGPLCAIQPLVWQCRYSGIYVPDDCIEAFELNAGTNYADQNDKAKTNRQFLDRASMLVDRVINYIRMRKA